MLELTGERVLEKLYDNAEVSKKTGKLPHTVEEAATGNLIMKSLHYKITNTCEQFMMKCSIFFYRFADEF